MKVGALCAGYGGLELGLQLAGLETELMWVAETDPGASKVLDKRFNVPNLGDIKLIENPVKVDAITAGFPCQPVSIAGAGAGVNDERWLIDDVVRVAAAADAQWIFLENVRGLLAPSKSEAFGQVLDALSNAGYDAKWSCVRADKSVGACHRRDRWFCIAENTTNSVCKRLERHRREHQLSEGSGQVNFTWGDYDTAIKRWEQVIGREAPKPVRGQRMNSRFVEWMMGLPLGWVTDIGLSFPQEIQLLGNGVVPQQVAFAYDWLLSLTD
jgi:DNA (cytosine-5)-methyltransferase 1